jgi:uncharacterized membrane protein YgcG
MHCEIDIDDCADSPCQNGGVCIDETNGYTCSCHQGLFTGKNCEIEITQEETVPTTQAPVPTQEYEASGSVVHHHHHHHHYYHGGHIYVNSGCGCGGGMGLQRLFAMKAGAAWMKHLFAKKNNSHWLKVLLEKKEITSEQHEWISELLAKREEEKSDETDVWWKNLFEKKYSGAKPFWGKDIDQKHKFELEQKHQNAQKVEHSWEHKWEVSASSPEELAEKIEAEKKKAAEKASAEKEKFDQKVQDAKQESKDQLEAAVQQMKIKSKNLLKNHRRESESGSESGSSSYSGSESGSGSSSGSESRSESESGSERLLI